MKSKVLVKLVLVFLLTSGVIVFLGSKAMVSAECGIYGMCSLRSNGSAPICMYGGMTGGLGNHRPLNNSVFDAYGAKVSLPSAGLYHSGSEMVAQINGGLYGGLRTQRPDVLTAEPRLTSTPSVSTLKRVIAIPTTIWNYKLESKISPPRINPSTSKTSCDKVAFSLTTVWFK